MHRREFLVSASAFGALGVADASLARPAAPAILTRRAARPVVVSSSNGHWFRNGGTKTSIETAYEMIVQRTDVLDALIAGVNIDELDPAEPYVGYVDCPTRTAWCSSMPRSCMDRRSEQVAWRRSKAFARRRWWLAPSWK
jgi:N4-(beta-N-acetylglucosaminyl)-L-asparaginase